MEMSSLNIWTRASCGKGLGGKGIAHPLTHVITLKCLMMTTTFISFLVISFMLSRHILNGKIHCKMAKQIPFLEQLSGHKSCVS
jgi:hypothetical protein